MADLDDDLAALYRLPREEFTAARDKLARRLKREGEGDRAERVRTLKKPTVVAWVANRLAHSAPTAVEALVDAGERLRVAQEAALSSGGGDELRAATRALRHAIAEAMDVAEKRVGARGSALAELPTTLQAAATDPAGQKLLRDGRLTDALDPTGFGTVEVSDDDAGRSDELRRARDKARRELERLERDAAEAEAEADRLETKAVEAEEGAARARRAADAAALAAEDGRRRVDDWKERHG